MSEMAKRPLGLSIRKASRYTFNLSGDKLITQFDMIISALLSATGRCSISPNRNSTLAAPIFSAFFLALEIISGVMSTPMTCPLSPTCLTARKQSKPPPLPRSTTVSPGLSEARATGLPQPSPIFAPSITPAISSFEYPMTVDICSGVTSELPQQEAAAFVSAEVSDGPQQDAVGRVPIETPPALATFP